MVDEYVFPGDITLELPFGNEVLNTIKSISKYAVRGNKEDYITEYDKNKYKWENIQFKNAIFLYNLFTHDNLEYINNLPLTLSLEFEGINLFVCHGQPESVEEKILENDINIMNKYTKDLKEDILVFGHTHEKIWTKKLNEKCLINSGCSGVSPYNANKAEYVILDIENGKYNIIKRLVEFNLEKLKNMIIQTGILDADKVLMNLTYLALCGKGNIRYEFFKEAKAISYQRGNKLYKDDATGVYKYFKLFDDDIWLSLAEKYKNEFEL